MSFCPMISRSKACNPWFQAVKKSNAFFKISAGFHDGVGPLPQYFVSVSVLHVWCRWATWPLLGFIYLRAHTSLHTQHTPSYSYSGTHMSAQRNSDHSNNLSIMRHSSYYDIHSKQSKITISSCLFVFFYSLLLFLKVLSAVLPR